MTSEERERMNRLCVGIQEETDYNKFAALLHEMSELIEVKEHRRYGHHPKLVWHGGPVALTEGARLDVTFEAESNTRG
jgi:hypothetical protein